MTFRKFEMVGMETGGVGSMLDSDEGGASVNICLKAATTERYRGAHGLKLSVPAGAGRKALRKLIHHLLQTSLNVEDDDDEEQGTTEDKPNFHFLADDEPLRTTLGAFLSRRGRSREETVMVTYYIPLPVPRVADEKKPSSNWLSSISVLEAPDDDSKAGSTTEFVEGLPLVLVGSYSGSTVVYRGGTEVVAENAVSKEAGRHSGPIKAVAWASNREFVTASLDQTVRLWSMQVGPEYGDSKGSARAVAEFRSEEVGQPVAFHSVATRSDADSDNIRIATGGEDGSVWMLNHTTESLKDVPVGKSASTQNGGEGDTVKLGKRRRAALNALPATRVGAGTTQTAVTGLQWTQQNQLISGGLDGFVRVWDVEACALSTTVPCGNKSLLSLSLANDADGEAATKGKMVIVVGAADGGVRVVDASGGGMTAACGRKGAHNGVVTGVAWVHTDRHIASGGVDGSIRLWDVRAMAMPVRVVSNVHGGQASMAVAVAQVPQGRSVYSVGADGRLVTLELKA